MGNQKNRERPLPKRVLMDLEKEARKFEPGIQEGGKGGENGSPPIKGDRQKRSARVRPRARE